MPWRRRATADSLRRAESLWTLSAVAHAVPFLVFAILLPVADPVLVPFGLIALGFAWTIPDLYAARGAGVLRPAAAAGRSAEHVALGLLGDLVSHPARKLAMDTGFAVERGRLGVWLLGQRGALLVRPGGRRVHCYCVRVPEPDLPAADRVAHLLLALRADEPGFATLANRAFAGAPWRVLRRLPAPAGQATRAAIAAARTAEPS